MQGDVAVEPVQEPDPVADEDGRDRLTHLLGAPPSSTTPPARAGRSRGRRRRPRGRRLAPKISALPRRRRWRNCCGGCSGWTWSAVRGAEPRRGTASTTPSSAPAPDRASSHLASLSRGPAGTTTVPQGGRVEPGRARPRSRAGPRRCSSVAAQT
jgi:hypothetical protein